MRSMSMPRAPASRRRNEHRTCASRALNVHSRQPPALEAVLRTSARRACDRIVVGGDALPARCRVERLDLLYSLDIPTDFIIGNGDRETAAAARGHVGSVDPGVLPRGNALECGATASRAISQAIDSWPLTKRLTVDGIGDVLFCSRHAAERHGDLPEDDVRRHAAADFRSARRAARRLRPHAHAVRSHRRPHAHRQRRQRRHAVPGRRAPTAAVRLGAGESLRLPAYDLDQAAVTRARDRLSASGTVRGCHPRAARPSRRRSISSRRRDEVAGAERMASCAD